MFWCGNFCRFVYNMLTFPVTAICQFKFNYFFPETTFYLPGGKMFKCVTFHTGSVNPYPANVENMVSAL